MTAWLANRTDGKREPGQQHLAGFSAKDDMANMFKSLIEDKFNAVWLPSVDGGVAVVNGSNSTQGIVFYDTGVNLENRQISEAANGSVKVIADNIGTVTADGSITVAETRVFVTATSLDASGAIMKIEFSKSQPVPEEML